MCIKYIYILKVNCNNFNATEMPEAQRCAESYS